MLLWGLKGSWTLEVGAAPLAFSKPWLAEGTPPKLCFGGDVADQLGA